MIEDLKAFCIINSELKAKTHNLKWYLSPEISKFLNCCLRTFSFLASFSVVFKHKSLIFVNWSLLLYDVSIFWLEHLYILPQISETSLEGARTKPGHLEFGRWMMILTTVSNKACDGVRGLFCVVLFCFSHQKLECNFSQF